MPNIVFISPKGGAGKTTSALMLATQLAKKSQVIVVDADPNKPIKSWSEGGYMPSTMKVWSEATEDNIADVIDEAAQNAPFVIVDLEGTASKIVVMALARADFVIIPVQGSKLDAEQAAKALGAIRQQEKSGQRFDQNYKLPYKVLLTRTNQAIRARTLRHIEESLIKNGIPIFETEMNDREAFRAVFSFNMPLEKLSNADVPNVERAIINAEAFAVEVINELKKLNRKE